MSDPLQLHPLSPGTFRADVPPDQAQGRAAFGGFLAGLALRAMERVSEASEGRPLRSLLADFVAPVAPGPVEVSAVVLRAGRALTHVEARVRAGDGVAAVFIGAFGAARPTRLAWPAPDAPPLGDVDARPSLPFLEGVTPAFTQHFEYRWGHGFPPFTGATEARYGGWVRPRRGGPVDMAGILALVDAWPAPILSIADRVVPASTVTWMVDLFGVPVVAPGGWWRFESATVRSAEGYVDIDAKLWAPDGTPVATSRQAVVEFSA
jgi:acyl-CoA thioesterase